MVYICKHCDMVSDDPLDVYKHCQLCHSHLTDGFYCPFASCFHRFKKKSLFISHINRDHGPTFTYVFKCVICGEKYKLKTSFLTHLKEHVKINETVNCPFCFEYKTNIFGSFTSHLYRKHDPKTAEVHEDYCQIQSEIVNNQGQNSECFNESDTYLISNSDGNVSGTAAVNGTDDAETYSIQNEEDSPAGQNTEVSEENLELMLANLFLKMNSVYQIPNITLSDIVEQLNTIHTMEKDQWLENIQVNLRKKDMSEEDIKKYMPLIASEIQSTLYKYTQPGESLSSQHRRQEYYKENMPYVAPKEYVLQQKTQDTDLESYQYVPIIPVITEALSKIDLLDEVIKPLDTQVQGQYSSFADGIYFKELVLIHGTNELILLALYADDVEVSIEGH